MNGKESKIELRDDMRNIRFGRDCDLTPPHGGFDSIHQTLFGYFNYKGPGYREKLFSVTLIVDSGGRMALEGWDEEQRHILMRPLKAQRGCLLVHDGGAIINALFGHAPLNSVDRMEDVM